MDNISASDKDNISASRVCGMSDSHLRPGAALTCKCMKIKLQKWWWTAVLYYSTIYLILCRSSFVWLLPCVLFLLLRLYTRLFLFLFSHFHHTPTQRHNALHHNHSSIFKSDLFFFTSWNGGNTVTMMIKQKQKPTPYTTTPQWPTFIRCGYFVRKCRYSSTAAGAAGGYVVPCGWHRRVDST